MKVVRTLLHSAACMHPIRIWQVHTPPPRAADRVALLLAHEGALLRAVFGAALANIARAASAEAGSTEFLTAMLRLAAQLRLLRCAASALLGGQAGVPPGVQAAARACNELLDQLPAWLTELSELRPADALVSDTLGSALALPALGSAPSDAWVAAFGARLEALLSAAGAAEQPPARHDSPAELQLAADGTLGRLRCANPACVNLAGSS